MMHNVPVPCTISGRAYFSISLISLSSVRAISTAIYFIACPLVSFPELNQCVPKLSDIDPEIDCFVSHKRVESDNRM